MSTSPSRPHRERTRRQEEAARRSSSDHSDGSRSPPANEHQLSGDGSRTMTAESTSASPSPPPEQRASAKVRSTKRLYPPGARLASWPHFSSAQGQHGVRDDLNADASLYGEVQRIASHCLQDRKSGAARQAAEAPAPTSRPEALSDLDQGGELAPSTHPVGSSSASSSSSQSSSPASPHSPSSPMSSRSASSLEFPEDDDPPTQVQPSSTSHGSDDDSQPSASAAGNLQEGGGERSLLPDTLMNPLVLGVQARLDALLHTLAMEHSARQRRASSKKERKRLMGQEEVLTLLEREVERGPRETVELLRRKSVLKRTREKIVRALDLEPTDEMAGDPASEMDDTRAFESVMPDLSAHDPLGQVGLQGTNSTAQQDAALLLEPLGLLRPVGKRKRKPKEKKPSREVSTTEECVETKRPRKAEKEMGHQVIRGGGGFLLCRPPISNAPR